jgi:hypothetical protein
MEIRWSCSEPNPQVTVREIPVDISVKHKALVNPNSYQLNLHQAILLLVGTVSGYAGFHSDFKLRSISKMLSSTG